jgi:adenylate cyclase
LIEGTNQHRGHILVVDDNRLNRSLLARHLERRGHTVALADQGRQALDMIGEDRYDLVLLDVLMPEMDGYEVLQRIKGDPDWRNIPVIMISALEEMDSVVRCIELGAEDYLPKPFDPVLLKARINACLEKKRLRDREVLYLEQIEAEKMRSDELLHVILPPEIVQELKATDTVKPRDYQNVAVLFSDIVGFTAYCDTHTPEEVVSNLQELVEAYEELALKHDLQKIKTAGDAFMAAGGLLKPLDNPVLNCVQCGLEMLSATRRLPVGWQVRIGIHLGPVMAGVVGGRQYLFDVWGDTVNTAQRIESHGASDAVSLSKVAWQQVDGHFQAESLGLVEVKGKGALEIFRVRE